MACCALRGSVRPRRAPRDHRTLVRVRDQLHPLRIQHFHALFFWRLVLACVVFCACLELHEASCFQFVFESFQPESTSALFPICKFESFLINQPVRRPVIPARNNHPVPLLWGVAAVDFFMKCTSSFTTGIEAAMCNLRSSRPDCLHLCRRIPIHCQQFWWQELYTLLQQQQCVSRLHHQHRIRVHFLDIVEAAALHTVGVVACARLSNHSASETIRQLLRSMLLF